MAKKYFYDILLIFGFLLIGIIIFFIATIGVNGENLTAQLWHEDKMIETINLANQDKTKTKTISLDGDIITVEYKHNSIRVIYANCQNQICKSQGWTSSENKPIICMQNHFKIVIISNYSDYDIMVG